MPGCWWKLDNRWTECHAQEDPLVPYGPRAYLNMQDCQLPTHGATPQDAQGIRPMRVRQALQMKVTEQRDIDVWC
ncbi:hypothetical protein Hypma_000343 [Hypsizygus marmoreus]|uniref:Uncharacterized protein n=1 Tax=Hypsizygus marmoreus TaxID=39966 RepID=A0A369JG90_HYPMA|nr:hypothetical protein Hypma_000343 [Hypsizygus marmoreus]